MCTGLVNWMFGGGTQKVAYRQLGYYEGGDDEKKSAVAFDAVAPAVIPNNMNRQDKGRLKKLNDKINSYNECIGIIHVRSNENDSAANLFIQKWHDAKHDLDRKTFEKVLIGKLKFRQDYQHSLCTYYLLVDKCKHYTTVILQINVLKLGTKAKLDNNIPGDIDGLEEKLAQELDAFLEADTASQSLHSNISAKIAQESPDTDAEIQRELKELLHDQQPTVELLRAQFEPLSITDLPEPSSQMPGQSDVEDRPAVRTQPRSTQLPDLMAVEW